jgi:hypothetical protein
MQLNLHLKSPFPFCNQASTRRGRCDTNVKDDLKQNCQVMPYDLLHYIYVIFYDQQQICMISEVAMSLM